VTLEEKLALLVFSLPLAMIVKARMACRVMRED
jgi:hypothetical protein